MPFSQEELDGLLEEAAEHLHNFADCSQAAYHCMCERKEGNSIDVSLQMASLIGKLKAKFKELESYRVIGDE